MLAGEDWEEVIVLSLFAAAVNAETSGLLTNALGNGLALAVMIYSTAGICVSI